MQIFVQYDMSIRLVSFGVSEHRSNVNLLSTLSSNNFKIAVFCGPFVVVVLEEL